jgi:hypothetical protein
MQRRKTMSNLLDYEDLRVRGIKYTRAFVATVDQWTIPKTSKAFIESQCLAGERRRRLD